MFEKGRKSSKRCGDIATQKLKKRNKSGVRDEVPSFIQIPLFILVCIMIAGTIFGD